MHAYTLLLLAALIFIEVTSPANAAPDQQPMWNETWTDKLKKDLFLMYDKFARPTQYYNTTTVKFDITILHVSVDEFKSTVTLVGWAYHTWNDDKLKWDTSKYGDIQQIHVGNHEVWQPDIYLYNSGTANTIEHYGDSHCIVYHDGKVLWVPPAQFVALCELDLRLWPFDTQVCDFKLGSWTFHGEQIDLRLNDRQTQQQPLIEKAEWKLVNLTRKREAVLYPCCEEAYITVTFRLTLKRNSALYYSLLMTPAAAVMFLTLATFWLSPRSEMKVTVAACNALIITVFLVYFGIKVPPTTTPPLIVCFYGGCLCLVTISLILAVFVINLSKRPDCKPLPRNVRLFLLSWPGKLLGLSDLIAMIEVKKPMPGQEMRHKGPEELSANSTSNIAEDCERQNIISPLKNTTQLEWILAGTAVDRITFIIFCVILGIMAVVCMS